MRIVVAPDKFKGSLSASAAAEALATGVRRVRPDSELVVLPVADGGDGTVDAMVAAGYSRVEIGAVGPLVEPVATSYARRGDEAVVELATVVGLRRLPGGVLAPLDASTYGFGVVVADAIERGASKVVLGLGGSASTDGGAGLVEALGARLVVAEGGPPARGGRGLGGVSRVEIEGLVERTAGIDFVIASDVDNPLLGPRGSAAVFGPQKGADAASIDLLERGLGNWAEVVYAAGGQEVAQVRGAGAAGGTAFAALSLLGATLVPGIDLLLDLVDFEDRLAGADLVVTGEGSLDAQTLGGKAPAGVAARASRKGVPVVAVAGRVDVTDTDLDTMGIVRAYPLSAIEPDPQRSIMDAADLLARVGEQIAREWAT